MAITLKISGGKLRQLDVGDSVDAASFERRAVSGDLVVGSSLGSGEFLKLGSITSTADVLGPLRLRDRASPANPGAGFGLLFKKTGNDGIFWRPDVAGAEIDLTSNSERLPVQLIYEPGGAPGGNRYDDFNQLYIAFQTFINDEWVEIIIDLGDSMPGDSTEIPKKTGGGAYDFDQRVTLASRWPEDSAGNYTVLTWEADCQVIGLTHVRNLVLRESTNATPVFNKTAAHFITFSGYCSGIHNYHATNAPFLRASETTDLYLTGIQSLILSTLGAPAVEYPLGATGSFQIVLDGLASEINGEKAIKNACQGFPLSIFAIHSESQLTADTLDTDLLTTTNVYLHGGSAADGTQTITQQYLLGTVVYENRGSGGQQSGALNLTAAGVDQAGAFQLPWGLSQTTTCAVGAGVKFPKASTDNRVIHTNDGANPEIVYPFLSGDLGAGVDIPITIAVGQTIHYIGLDDTKWRRVSGDLSPLAVTYAASPALNVSVYEDFEIGPLTGNCAITLTNGSDGKEGLINVIQDGIGGLTVTISAAGRTVVKSTSLASLTAAAAPGAQTVYWYRFYTVNAVGYLQVSMDYLA